MNLATGRRCRAVGLGVVGLVSALALSVRPALAQVLPHEPTIDRLPNGLTVVVLPFDSPGIAAYFTLVRTGSRDEVEPGHSGFAHLFEHMMFRGTRTLNAAQYEFRMQALGADNNAYTTDDFTLYTITLPSTSVPGLIPVEADRFQHLFYSEQMFQTETHAVLGEYNKNSASPSQGMWEQLSELAFSQHTYGHTTMGYLRDIQAMPRYYRYAQQFFRRFYTPDNCTIIVAGDVHRDQILPLIQQHYGPWAGHRATPTIPVEPDQTAARSRALAWEGTTPNRMIVGYRIPAYVSETVDAVALQVVHSLAFTEASDLYQRLVVHDQHLLTLESWRQDFHRDPQLFIVEARLTPQITFDQVTQAIQDEIARIGRGEYPRERIAQVVSNLRYSLPMEAQTPSDAANLIARFVAMTGDVHALDRYVQHLQAVTPDDVARVARTYLLTARRSVITVMQADRAPAGTTHFGPNGSHTAARRPH